MEPLPFEVVLPDGRQALLTLGPTDSGGNRADNTIQFIRIAILGYGDKNATGSIRWQDVANNARQAGYRVEMHQALALEEAAQLLESGQIVVLLVNGGVLWGESASLDNAEANRCVIIRAFARHPDDGMLLTFWVWDPVRNETGKVATDIMLAGWTGYGEANAVRRGHMLGMEDTSKERAGRQYFSQ